MALGGFTVKQHWSNKKAAHPERPLAVFRPCSQAEAFFRPRLAGAFAGALFTAASVAALAWVDFERC
ncbi:hypothetical protein AA309_31055 [Microvirga vignae]|uniref:Uncharacterized protein n=1 Tax=Microvirga vignae TaxID=1225564 RepID=A0A0H1RA79_9HYPH|nr:hypothetical protein AA309_31055 [Microvirga vignae]